ncbi:radical SAM family heme chaperone HemW [Collinsella stercoris]|nr:radical SAM family heme chaperone HemW [Collinsella stercoris]UEA45994.1 radical SAM family heme chaperone HemW [Collinsella stercoris DSM 13279]UWP11487.1 radical SAM family heme chaperone HemW [Collinsella stercoris]
MKYRALYLHIPFCRAKCLYCDFDSRALTGCALEDAIGAYCEGLSAQVDAHGNAGELSEVETVYVGGGTPSLLGDRLVGLVDRVRAYCEPVEFTCEANPESFTLDLAQALRAAGVTRISLGVQSLNASELKAIGRVHSAEQAMFAIAQAKAAGFSTSCDVMCGLPGQTLDTFAETLRSLVTLNPDHVSVYPLQLEDGTPLARMEEAGETEVPDEDFQAQCMDLAAEVLKEAGYERYEVASYAKPGHRCRHNIAYWTGKSYLGLGRSAASMLDVCKGECREARFIACPDVQKGEASWTRGEALSPKEEDLSSRSDARRGESLSSCPDERNGESLSAREKGLLLREEGLLSKGKALPPIDEDLSMDGLTSIRVSSDVARIRFKQLDDAGGQFETEELSVREATAEDLMLACRMTDGISADLLARATGIIPDDELSIACQQAVEKGLAVWDGGTLRPTHLGWLEGNELFGIFWNLAYES